MNDLGVHKRIRVSRLATVSHGRVHFDSRCSDLGESAIRVLIDSNSAALNDIV